MISSCTNLRLNMSIRTVEAREGWRVVLEAKIESGIRRSREEFHSFLYILILSLFCAWPGIARM